MKPKLHDVYWLEQSQSEVPGADDWLSASECIRLNSLRFAKRRSDWRLGRWTAKRAVAAHLQLRADSSTLARIEVQTLPSGAPHISLDGYAASLSVSLSHRGGIAMCAVASVKLALGCDLEIAEERSDAFVRDYFAEEEQELLRRTPVLNRQKMIALLWSAKESALKALHQGLRLSTHSVITGLPGEADIAQSEAWHPLVVCHENVLFAGWWSHRGNMIRTIAASPAPEVPIPLCLAEANPPSVCLGSSPVPSPWP